MKLNSVATIRIFAERKQCWALADHTDRAFVRWDVSLAVAVAVAAAAVGCDCGALVVTCD